jgi:hypothetical protein
MKTMSLMKISASALTLLGALVGSRVANAQAPASMVVDTFTYPDGNLVTVPPTVWATHSGTAGTLKVAGNKALVEMKNGANFSEDANRALGSSLSPGETWYYALKVTVTDARAATTDPIFQNYFAHFKDGGTTNFRGRIWTTAGTDPTKFRFGVSSSSFTNPDTANDPDFDQNQIVDGNDLLIWQRGLGLVGPPNPTNTLGNANADVAIDEADLAKWKQFYGTPPGTIGQVVPWSADLDFGTEYTLVVSYTADDDESNPLLTSDGHASLWVNPTVIGDAKVTDTLSNPNIISDLNPTNYMSTIALRQGGNGPMTVAVDTLSVGSDFATVLTNLNSPPATAATAAVPEPASLGMLACGLLAMAVRRRR